MTEEHKNKYFLEGISLKEWWQIVEGEEKALKRGTSCVLRINPSHRHANIRYRTNNFICCATRGRPELTFVHSLDPVSISVALTSIVKLDGDLVVEGHRIRFSEIDTRKP